MKSPMISRVILFLSLLAPVLSLAQSKSELPAHVIKIPLDSDRTYAKSSTKQDEEIRVLKARVKVLEDATRQLQEEIYSIKYGHGAKPVALDNRPGSWYCVMKSAFNRTYSARATTQLEARSSTLAACEKEDSIHCKKEELECEKES